MDVEKLKEYLSIVVDIEQSIYLQERMISEVQGKCDRLGLGYTDRKPIEPKKPDQKKPMTIALVFLCLLVIVAGVCLFGYAIHRFGGPNTIGQLLGALACLPLGVLVVIAGIAGCYNALKFNDKKWSQYRRYEDEYDRKYRQYQRELNEYEQWIQEQQQRVEREMAEKRGLAVALQKMRAKYDESKQKLDEIYSCNIIFPKYRNLVMVCSIYEYLCSGRCASLEGHEGAYNLLEMEIRLDRIVIQLDAAMAKLDKIQQNQFMLYSAIKESNQKSAMILESTYCMADQLKTMQVQSGLQGAALNAQIEKLQKSSELTAYHAERTQKELHYMNRMNYLTGKNDGSFSELPPT